MEQLTTEKGPGWGHMVVPGYGTLAPTAILTTTTMLTTADGTTYAARAGLWRRRYVARDTDGHTVGAYRANSLFDTTGQVTWQGSTYDFHKEPMGPYGLRQGDVPLIGVHPSSWRTGARLDLVSDARLDAGLVLYATWLACTMARRRQASAAGGAGAAAGAAGA